jgi:hypothetical protein
VAFFGPKQTTIVSEGGGKTNRQRDRKKISPQRHRGHGDKRDEEEAEKD